MRVKIDTSVFTLAKDDDKLLELNFLLHIIFYRNRYEIGFTDGEILNSDSFRKLRPQDQKVIEDAIAYNIVSSASDFDCEVKIGGEIESIKKIFSPSEAIQYLLQPTSIILENGLNDSHFMNAIFHQFDSSRRLLTYLHEGWLRYENAGGCSNVQNFLKALVLHFQGKQKFLRCFVLLDGDKRFPTDSDKYKALKEKLNTWKVDYHVLEKRCMENYMPDEAMRSFSSDKTKEWVNAYMTLTPQQKDFYCIAEGFLKDISSFDKKEVKAKERKLMKKDLKLRKKSYVRSRLNPEEKSFYNSVSNGNFLHLEKGLEISNFKLTFPMKFNDTVVVYKRNMLDRTSHQDDPHELEHIVQKIVAQI